jgi:hypothetical protein
MKFRNGFVTNSSSSSFILSKKNLSKVQLDIIRNHLKFHQLGIEKWEFTHDNLTPATERDGWTLEETEDTISGHTFMDNFNMEELFINIGIEQEDYKFEEY